MAGNGNGHSGYPSREPRDRDAHTTNAAAGRDRERDWYNDKYGNLSGYEKDTINTVGGGKRRKIDNIASTNGSSAGYYNVNTAGATVRGEEGPRITFDLGSLPNSTILKYLQTYNLAPAVQPSPLSAQHPSSPTTALLKPPGTQSRSRAQGQGKYWEDDMRKSVGPNGITTNGQYHNNTSALGLSSTSLGPPVANDTTALYDLEEARMALVRIAQAHWDSNNLGYGPTYTSTPARINEREVIEDFMIALRAKELAIRLTI